MKSTEKLNAKQKTMSLIKKATRNRAKIKTFVCTDDFEMLEPLHDDEKIAFTKGNKYKGVKIQEDGCWLMVNDPLNVHGLEQDDINKFFVMK